MVHLPLHQRAHKVELERHHLRAKAKCVEVVLPGASAYGHAAVSWVLPFQKPLSEALRVGHLDAHRRHVDFLCNTVSSFLFRLRKLRYSETHACREGDTLKTILHVHVLLSDAKASPEKENTSTSLFSQGLCQCSRTTAYLPRKAQSTTHRYNDSFTFRLCPRPSACKVCVPNIW